MLAGYPVRTFSKDQALARVVGSGEFEERILVLVQLNGGNDGLNTIIPLDQYANLSKARSNILIPENKVLKLNNETGLHPRMSGIKKLFDEEKIGVVQSVGYPDPNLSHFRSTDIWTTASASDEVLRTGWLGRYLQDLHPEYPEGYPNEEIEDPLAVTVGSIVSSTCQGPVVNMGMAISDPNVFNPLLTSGESEVPETPYGHELAFLRNSMLQTNQYLKVIQAAAEKGSNKYQGYPARGANKLADQLKIVAQLISGGLKTKIYVVNLGGFDTHANQVAANDVENGGRHASLLAQLSTAIEVFQKDLQQLGIEEKVLGLTFSEFGRRIISNASLGTDHGAAAPLVVFGSRVNPWIHGNNPIISEWVGNKENVPMQYDFRSVYGSVLQDWFGADEAMIRELLFEDYQHIPLINTNTVSNNDDLGLEVFKLMPNYPNPFRSNTMIPFTLKERAKVQLVVFDAVGKEIRVPMERTLPPGKHEVKLEGEQLSAGKYFAQLRYKHYRQHQIMLKV